MRDNSLMPLDIFNPYCFDKPSQNPCNKWTAPEHSSMARIMRRTKRGKGELIIEENAIFAYSRMNPPAQLLYILAKEREAKAKGWL